MSNKPTTIGAGPASNDDFYVTSVAALASGPLVLDVLANDSRRSTLWSLDDQQVGDLLEQDGVLAPQQSRFGASIWLTADGRVSYAMDPAQLQSLAAGETIVDSFLYAGRLANGSLIWSTARVTISGANDAPTAHDDAAQAVEDSLASGSVAANDVDVDHGAVLSYAATGPLPAGFAMAADGSWTLDVSGPAYQSLGAGVPLELVIPYTVTDEHGAMSGATLTLVVTGTNDAPVAEPGGTTALEDEAIGGSLAGLASDADDGVLTFRADTNVAGFALAADGSWSFDGGHADYQSLAAGELLTFELGYTVTDSAGASAASTFTITIVGRNDAPVAQADQVEATEDAPASGSVAANDADADHGAQLSYALVPVEPPPGFEITPPGFVMNADGSWTLDTSDPDYQRLGAGESLQFLVAYRVTDEHGATSDSTFVLSIAGANDAPVVLESFQNGWLEEDGGWMEGMVSIADADASDTLHFTIERLGATPEVGFLDAFLVVRPGSGIHDLGWSYSVDPSLLQSLDEGQILEEQYVVTVFDGQGATATQIITIPIVGRNDAPLAAYDYAVAEEDNLVTGSLADNDVDPDRGAQLTYEVAGPGYPVPPDYPLTPPGFVLNGDGSWSLDTSIPYYQGLSAGETHTLEVRYVVTDEHGASSTASLMLYLIGSNDAPVVEAEWQDPYIDEDVGLMAGQIGFVDFDHLDFHTASSHLVDGPGLGSIVIDGIEVWDPMLGRNVLSWHYEADPAALQGLMGGEHVTEFHDITVSDGNGGTVTHVVAVHFLGQDDAPVATAGGVDVGEGNVIFGRLSDFAHDPDRFTFLTFSADAPPVGFTLLETGDWMFDASDPAYAHLELGETMDVVVPWTVIDHTGLSASSTFTITVMGAPGGTPPASWTRPAPYNGTGDPNDHDGLAGGPANNAAGILGNDTPDTITGGPAAQSIDGLGGDDRIYGGAGDDHLHGNGGNDTVYGQAGADWLKTGWGIDTLYGGSGNDELRSQTPEQEALTGTWPASFYGGSGADVLIGGGNNDLLVGGYGADTLTGGANRDTFAFNSTLDTNDRITDFAYGVDWLDFRGIDANPALAGDQAFLWSQAGPAPSSLWAVREGMDTIIFGDTDGNALSAEFMLTLSNVIIIETPGAIPSGFFL